MGDSLESCDYYIEPRRLKRKAMNDCGITVLTTTHTQNAGKELNLQGLKK